MTFLPSKTVTDQAVTLGLHLPPDGEDGGADVRLGPRIPPEPCSGRHYGLRPSFVWVITRVFWVPFVIMP